MDRHLEMQGDPALVDLPEYALRLTMPGHAYNMLAAQIQTNVARDGNGSAGDCGGDGLILNPHLRLVNHACDGNCNLAYAPAAAGDTSGCECRLGDYALQTVRAIRAGEELTYSYIGSQMLAAPEAVEERRALLHRRWGFHCECDLCRRQG